MYSSQCPFTAGSRYAPLLYGLNEMRYRVKHFGHSTQWRIRDIETLNDGVVSCVLGARLSSKMVRFNTHLTRLWHDHYDPRK